VIKSSQHFLVLQNVTKHFWGFAVGEEKVPICTLWSS
jgi:hypothetical protein